MIVLEFPQCICPTVAAAPPADAVEDSQPYSRRLPRQIERNDIRARAMTCGDSEAVRAARGPVSHAGNTIKCVAVRPDTMKQRGCSSVVERQPSKLNVEGSNPFARFR